VIAAVGLCSELATASITIADPLNGTPTTSFSGVGRFGDVGRFYGSASAFNGGRHILTARHLVTTDGTIGGGLKSPSSLRFQLDDSIAVAGSNVFASFDADLAIVELATQVNASFNLWLGASGDEVGATFTAVGFGGTDSDGDGLWGPSGFGSKRLFENKVNAIQSGTIVGQGQILRYDFDKTSGDPVGPLEGIHGPGDSGGGAFLFDGTQYMLAGVMSSSGNPISGATGSIVQVSAYLDTIITTVPEPSCLLVIGMVTIGIARRRRIAK
jgi:hypothetical protein